MKNDERSDDYFLDFASSFIGALAMENPTDRDFGWSSHLVLQSPDHVAN
jgi:hypothetical protein